MPLGPWGRILIMGIGALVVAFAILITACFVGPGCWGYEYLEKLSKRKKKTYFSSDNIQIVNSNFQNVKIARSGPNWLNSTQYELYQTGSDGSKAKLSNNQDISFYKSTERDINIKCTPFLVAPVFGNNIKDATPRLQIILTHMNLNKEGVMGRLIVNLIEATNLPCREYQSSLEPYLVLDILNNKWSLQKSERIVHTVQTRIVRHTHNPKFDQKFVFDVKKVEIKDWCLKFTIFDNDRLTRRTPLCEKRIYLKGVKNLMTQDQIEMNLELQELHSDNGELLFGVSYLPTAQRLSISIIKAARLKYLTVVPSLVDFYPYVRVLMLNNQGKCLKKKKTCFKHAEDHPIFNETLAFDLPTTCLENVLFLILLCTKSLSKVPSTDGSNTDTDVESSYKVNKDKVLGVIALSRNVKSVRTRDHWVTVMQNPRKVISVWQTLR